MSLNRARAAIRNVVGLFVLLTTPVLCMRAQNVDEACGTKAEQQKKEVQLRATVAEMLRVIKSRDSSAFLKYVDKEGVSIWGGILTPSEIKREFRHKQGIYCLLLSTGCIASASFPNGTYINVDKWQISYAEWLQQNSPTKTEIEMFYGDKDTPCVANVSIRRIKESHPAQETFELGYNYRSGRWLFRGTPAYPEGIA